MSAVTPRPVSGKRPISKVIDLTLSSDDDEPPRSAKRQNTKSTSNLALGLSNGGASNGDGSRVHAVNFRLPSISAHGSANPDLALR